MLDNYPLVRPGPPKPSVIIEPRVFSLPAGTERYVVEGAGAILVPVHAGDTFTITNDEGGQPCEIVVTDKAGKLSPEILGHASSASADGLKALLTSSDQSLRGLRMGLDARGIDLAQTGAIGLFGAETPAGTCESFSVASEGTLIVAAPGTPMDFETQNTSTPLTVMLTRAKLQQNVRFALPTPLADPIADIRVHTQTA